MPPRFSLNSDLTNIRCECTPLGHTRACQVRGACDFDMSITCACSVIMNWVAEQEELNFFGILSIFFTTKNWVFVAQNQNGITNFHHHLQLVPTMVRLVWCVEVASCQGLLSFQGRTVYTYVVLWLFPCADAPTDCMTGMVWWLLCWAWSFLANGFFKVENGSNNKS
jgi:hypothetical protein